MRKNLYPLYFILVAIVIGLGYLTSVYREDMEKTVPKMKLSYFPSISELAQAVVKGVESELQSQVMWVKNIQ